MLSVTFLLYVEILDDYFELFGNIVLFYIYLLLLTGKFSCLYLLKGRSRLSVAFGCQPVPFYFPDLWLPVFGVDWNFELCKRSQ